MYNDNKLAARELEIARNTDKLIRGHDKVTNGKIITRFPPEPNGYLHIGHAKSMNMNFKMAYDKLGVPPENRMTILRYDDTNPETETEEYVDAIREDVEWMGWTPHVTTHSSDYFEELHALAIRLIKNGLAYVCHQTKEEITACREVAKARQSNPNAPGELHSPYRDRPVEENLRLFEDMTNAKFEGGTHVLRLKMDMTHPNPNMWDTVAYRIRHMPHPNCGDKWCVYPTYDYTHCIVDSLEHIDYSICTLEFENRRESYYWLLRALNIFRPNVYEFARLNITYTVLSKRKLLKLVTEGIVRGWDDPRMPTIRGFRRRGYTATVINKFCESIGVARADNVIEYEKLQHFARSNLDSGARRVMACLNPVKVVISGEENGWRSLSVPDFPQDPSSIKRDMCFGPEVYVDASDIREEDSNDFFGFAPGKVVGLRHACCVRCDEIVKGSDRKIELLRCSKVDVNDGGVKPKGWITWVACNDAVPIEVRLYEHLFTVPQPTGDWETELNPNSEVLAKQAVVDRRATGAHIGDAFQFERFGYFVVDQDTTSERMVLNRIVTLRESGIKKDASRSRKDSQMAAAATKEARKKIPPQEFFRRQTSLYSLFDVDGVPTHDAAGESLSKSSIKKLRKEWEKQKKLYGT